MSSAASSDYQPDSPRSVTHEDLPIVSSRRRGRPTVDDDDAPEDEPKPKKKAPVRRDPERRAFTLVSTSLTCQARRRIARRNASFASARRMCVSLCTTALTSQRTKELETRIASLEQIVQRQVRPHALSPV